MIILYNPKAQLCSLISVKIKWVFEWRLYEILSGKMNISFWNLKWLRSSLIILFSIWFQYDMKYYYAVGVGQTVRKFWFKTPPQVGPDVPYTFGLIGILLVSVFRSYTHTHIYKHHMSSHILNLNLHNLLLCFFSFQNEKAILARPMIQT